MKIYVGNLTFYVTEDDIKELFKEYGSTESIAIVRDLTSGKSKGFGFIEMPFESEAKIAIDCLDGIELKGRELIVNEAVARPKTIQKKGLSEKKDEKKDTNKYRQNKFAKKKIGTTTNNKQKENQTDRKPRRQGSAKNDQSRNRKQTDKNRTFQSKGRTSQNSHKSRNRGNHWYFSPRTT